jgi:HEPN domain-containing protein
MASADNHAQTQPRNITLTMGEPPAINLTCYGFHVFAEDFLTAAKMYAPVARKAAFVGHFLCCQSVELSLKAFLSRKGMSREEMRTKYGHKLSRLYDEACRQGLKDLVDLKADDVALLAKATEWYDVGHGKQKGKGKRLQYFSVIDAMMGFRDAPDLAGLEGLASRLQAPALRDAVLKA